MVQNSANQYNENCRSELSPEQLNAIDLLLTGATDQHVADTISRHRNTVTRWRLYHPHFRTELIRRRREAYGGAVDALRAVIPMAMDTLRDQLRVGPGRGAIALNLLHKAGLTAAPLLAGANISAAEDDDQILTDLLDAEIRRRRAAMFAEDPDDEFATPPNAPITEEDRQAALDHLLLLASESE